jgi:PKD domain/Secretion system C-terminal sorting domain
MQRVPTPLLLLFAICFFGNLSAQYTMTCTPNAGMTGQSVAVSILGSGVNFTGATSTYLHNGTGSYIYPSNWTVINPTNVVANYNIPLSATLGSYDVIVATTGLYNMANGFSILPGGYIGNYGQVTGKVYRDANANCVQNIGEPVAPNNVIEFLPGPYYALSDINGNYSVWLPLGSYTASYRANLPYTTTCPVGGTYNMNLTTNGQLINGQDFATEVVPYSDGIVYFYGQLLRPGFISNQYFHVGNIGTIPITSGVVKCLKPSFATLISATPAVSSTVGDTLIWNFGNLPVGQWLDASFAVQIPANTPLGTPYSFPIWLTTTPTDSFPSNNYYSQQRIVSGSYDPNEKLASLPNGQNADGDILPTDSVINYQVHFQNTGTDTAFNIYVRDTLDVAHLDLSTFKILGASHNYQFHFSGNAGELEVSFPNILLPDSGTNQAGSNGSFSYQIQRRSNLPVTTVISNTAAIYFDFNVPVITNTTETRICDGLSATFTSSSNLLSYVFQSQTAGAVSYLWTYGDGGSDTSANATHVYASAGMYQVCLTVTNSCGTSYMVCDSIVATAVGIADPAAGLQVQILPNPMQQQAQITVTQAGRTGSYALTLYNLAGQSVAQVIGEMNTPLVLDRKQLASGLYFAHISQQGNLLRVVKVLME